MPRSSPPSLPPGLIVIHSNLSESLRDVLVGWMRGHPLGPLEREVVLVQSSGIAQWLKLALAADPRPGAAGGGAGIAAAFEFLLPSRFLWRAYRAVLGAAAVPEVSPFDKPRLMWRLLRLLPEVMEQPVYAPLRRFLRDDADCRKRYQLAERLADVFDQYQVYRADWLAAWAAGRDTLPRDGGAELPLPPSQRWQAALWRAVLDDVKEMAAPIGAAPSSDGRAAVHAAFLRRAADLPDDAVLPGLPRRLIVFGISTLPRQSLEVLAVLSRWTQVLMCVNNPCEHYWADIIEGKDLLRAAHARQQRRQGSPAHIGDDELHLHAHPLLAAWGKQGRDFIGLLDEHDDPGARARLAAALGGEARRLDLFEAAGDDTLLRQLQDDIRDLRPLRETRARWPAVDPARDASIRFHVAHSRQREVEILHDQLLAAFDQDATLRPRDVIVMVPDIEAYAPHIQAVFGLHERDDPRAIPYTIADRVKRHADPLLHAVEQLLQLPRARFAVSEFMDLLEVPAVRERYGVAEDQLPLLHAWIRGANIRWGLHDAQRQALGLPSSGTPAAQNSWLFGLRRMLLGYAVGARAANWQGIEPYDDIGGLDAALLGPLVAVIDDLEQTWLALAEPAPPRVWGERLAALLERFFQPGESADAYTVQQLNAALREWLEVCEEGRVTEALPLSVVAEHWLSRLDEGGLSQRFFGGAVTFATLMPMRAIPFRIVCLLGMNDGEYPRIRMPMDFDLMAYDYRPGDRSRREDDRYLFLEALLSARDRLLISWIGRSVRDNTPRPPSVLVGQLRDHLAAGWRLQGPDAADAADADAAADSQTAAGDARAHDARAHDATTAAMPQPDEALLAALTTEHRLQPFSPAYFSGESPELFTYAREWRGGARGGGAMQALPPVVREDPLTLRELADFVRAPVDAFFKQRLQVSFVLEDAATEDVEPFVPDSLEQWQLQDALIRAQSRALEAGQDYLASREAEAARIGRAGLLPDGAFGALTAGDLIAPLDDMAERYGKALERWPHAMQEEFPIAVGGIAGAPGLEDSLGAFRRDDEGRRCRLLVDSSSLIPKGKYRAARVVPHWVAHVAAQLAGEPVTTVIVSKAGDVVFPPLSRREAMRCMRAWLRGWQAGMSRPLPLAVGAAFEWLTRHPAPPEIEAAIAAGPAEGGAANDARMDGEEAEEDPAPWDGADEGGLGALLAAPAAQAARKVYEGAAEQRGEVDGSPYLQAVYPDFAALARGGEFFTLAQAWLRTMRAMLYADRAKGKAASPSREGEHA
ncbi:exodeoxyribonuclease V subunit gamma [Bordetella bronchialis]|uniref:RecBCD enzyme subunit RecC n=1 Tax=Bordetella bronchialis TaxID=463025 RepID=A0ABM6CMN1_9BORD|nr:exodeoxyribonuclease V subunit gamma [Bordetella bronchialis]ANN65155.1 exodeoxyribonuclease V subunit gamma [Bordetella bronchialis]